MLEKGTDAKDNHYKKCFGTSVMHDKAIFCFNMKVFYLKMHPLTQATHGFSET